MRDIPPPTDDPATGTGGHAGDADAAVDATADTVQTGQDPDAGLGADAEAGASPVLAATPPMGWNSWNRFASNVNAQVIRQIADAMVTSGMAAAGYQYVIIDDTWQSSRDADGNIVPDSARFPDMKALADYVHGKGLKFGLYSDRGTATCGGRPGSYGYEQNDANTYAAWGVDYLKYDNCNPAPGRDRDPYMQQDYTVMRDALVATGRPVVYSICAWWYYDWEPSVGHLWRTTTDITDTWASVISLVNKNGGYSGRYSDANYGFPGIASKAGPGHWNDPDMLEVGNGGMSATEYRSHFSLWAMMAAPLIAGNDLRTMTQVTKDILTNPEVIAVDQDPAGHQGQPISASTTLEVWSKPLSAAGSYAVLLFNRTAEDAPITVTWSSLGIASASAQVRDLWARADLGSIADGYTATVPAHGVVMLKVVAQ